MADNIFVYTGGEQVVPRNVTHVRIDRSVKIIPEMAFQYRHSLIYVEFHDGIERIGKEAFFVCPLLSGSVKLLGVKAIESSAFAYCVSLTDLEFGDKLETIGSRAFADCTSLRNVKISTVKTIECMAFGQCEEFWIYQTDWRQ
jgi:hypothetical protein